MDKRDILREPIEHIDIKVCDATAIIEGMRGMSFTARGTAWAADILNMMLASEDCTVILCLAGSTSAAAGCHCDHRRDHRGYGLFRGPGLSAL
jgi:deoxyhypusine synthase